MSERYEPQIPASPGAPGEARPTGPQELPVAPEGPQEKAVQEARAALNAVRGEVGKVVVGQEAAVSTLVVALLAGGHVLLEGVPGVAKTLLVRTLGAALDVTTKRVQFTPDLMPGDITGSMLYDAGRSQFEFRPGPVFTNLLLADEINRTPPKTQAALLEAMAEHQVTVDGTSHELPTPFLVAATQNPIEFEGTYTLPEAQRDRFLMRVVMSLPARETELEILRRHLHGTTPDPLELVQPVATPAQLAVAARAVRGVRVEDAVLGYVVDIAAATRRSSALSLGVSPRAATALVSVAQAWAWLSGRDFVTPDDVRALAQVTLAHRLVLRSEAEMDGLDAGAVLGQVLTTVPVPR